MTLLAVRATIGGMDLNEQIREAMRGSTYTIVELSARTGIHTVNLSQFKSGTRNISLANLERLADALGVNITISKRKPK